MTDRVEQLIIEIPERALEAAWLEDTTNGIRVAAPIIVAAAFRRYAEVIETRASDASYTKTEEVVTALLDEAKRARDYADRLDPSTTHAIGG